MGMFFDGPVGVSEDMQLAAVPQLCLRLFLQQGEIRALCVLCRAELPLLPLPVKLIADSLMISVKARKLLRARNFLGVGKLGRESASQ